MRVRARPLPPRDLAGPRGASWTAQRHSAPSSAIRQFLARLCALVPPPGFHMTRYYGVFASHHRLRERVIPKPAAPPPPPQLPLDFTLHDDSPASSPGSSPRPRRIGWAKLLARIFALDITRGRKCGGRMRVLEVVSDADAIARILHGARAPPAPPPPGLSALLEAREEARQVPPHERRLPPAIRRRRYHRCFRGRAYLRSHYPTQHAAAPHGAGRGFTGAQRLSGAAEGHPPPRGRGLVVADRLVRGVASSIGGPRWYRWR